MSTVKRDAETTIEELKQLVVAFRDERGWGKHHTPKNLAMSIAIEAAELMEVLQWDEYTKRNQEKIADELADVLIYCYNLADVTGIDIATAFKSKLERAKEKYPLELFNTEQDSPDEYDRIKKAYRQNEP